MTTVRAAFIGDIVGKPGRRALAHALPILRQHHHADTVIVNAENARHGRGPNPATYNELTNTPAGGPDALTLGDHALDDPSIRTVLAQPDTIIARPWNLPGFEDTHRPFAIARISKRSPLAGKQLPPIAVVTILGRAFMDYGQHPADPDPFTHADHAIQHIQSKLNDPLIIVEIHAEATSEKAAMAHHCATHHHRTVVAVVGTHTHCQTNDARIIPPPPAYDPRANTSTSASTEAEQREGGVAAMSDLGCTAPELSVIGFNPEQSISRLQHGAGQIHPEDAPATTRGALITIDTQRRVATHIHPINIPPTIE